MHPRQRLRPPPASRQTKLPSSEFHGEFHDDDDVGADEAEDYLPHSGAELNAGDLQSAARVWLAVIELNEVLHTPFDDTSRSRRIEVGAECQAKGLAWVLAMRAHSGSSVSSNYMHLSSVLSELILHHGMLERSDDEILERDNRTAKRIKAGLLYWGGSSDPKQQKIVCQQFKEVKDDQGQVLRLELSKSERKRTAGQGE
eukprot:6189419-Pleurochrysis_carterae.AAC.2